MSSTALNIHGLGGTSDNPLYVSDASTASGSASTAFSTQATVAASSTRAQLLAANTSRRGFAFRNQGSGDAYVGNASVVTGESGGTANGGRLLRAGETLESSYLNDGYTGPWHVVCAANVTSVISVLEW